MKYRVIIACCFFCFFICCKKEVILPKPHAYPRIVFPTGEYKPMKATFCPMEFEIPSYTILEQRTTFFDDKPADSCWFTLQIPSLQASIHCSYGPINTSHTFDQYIEDAYTLLSKQNIKAEFREEKPLKLKKNVFGMAFEIDGPVATPYQFYLTDSSRHFFRAALYFNSKVNADSTRPILQFIKKDIEHLQNTFAWTSR